VSDNSTALTLEQRERVCREVLGWKPIDRDDPKAPMLFDVGEGPMACETAPAFTSWYDFGPIVDAMRKKGLNLSFFNCGPVGSRASVVFWRLVGPRKTQQTYVDYHPNPTVAAALAALKAVEEK